jgi:8-oxo-dGTP pyrophosphatase MutT (NUDIX family)
VLVYVHRPGPAFLLLRRIARLDGFWQGVTGAPEWGESDDDAARRELLEETGHDAPGMVTPVGFRYELHPPNDRSKWDLLYGPGVEAVPEEVYAAAAPAGWEPTLSWEHDEYRWCVLGDALELLRYEENREGLRAVARSLNPP